MGEGGFAAFYANTGMSATITNVIMGTVSFPFVTSGTMSGKITDIIMGNVTNATFLSTNDVTAKITNIIMGNVANYVIKCDNGDISGIITDIGIGNVGDTAFYAENGNITGTISDISMGIVSNDGFYASTGISSAMFNITMDDVSGYSLNAFVDITSTISYLKSNGAIYTGGLFKGKLINSELNCKTKGKTVVNKIHYTAKIQSCKLLADSTYYSLSAPTAGTTASIVYTITNRGFNNITPFISPNYNIDSTSII
jgi:hypothetical protein